MRHPIDPMVDCVFKAILGSQDHSHLLVHFLNSMLPFGEEAKVTSAQITNPFTAGRALDLKQTVFDVKAFDQMGRHFQIEVQNYINPSLTRRILYNWSQMYAASMKRGETYHDLKPAISVWLMGPNLFPKISRVHVPFTFYSPTNQIKLNDHCGIHVLQLSQGPPHIEEVSDDMCWLGFFKFGQYLDPKALPNWMQTTIMRDAMEILEEFSMSKENLDLYHSRLDRIRNERTLHRELEDAQEQLSQAQQKLQEKDQLLSQRDRALTNMEMRIAELEKQVAQLSPRSPGEQT